MSSFFYPTRHHNRTYGGHHNSHQHLTPYGGRQPSAFAVSPWADPFSSTFNFDQPFHGPFLSLFNDTFSELDRLSNELNTQISTKDSEFGKLLTLAPKFDIKETEKEFVLEGELPGVDKKDISLDFADDNTLVLKTRVEKVREEGEKPESQSQGQIEGGRQEQQQGQIKEADKSDKDTAIATTNGSGNKEVARPTTQYHLTERSVGTFQRAFALPGEIKHEEVKANLKNGILTITVPKVVKDAKEPEKKSRSVTIEEAPEEEKEGEKANA